MDLLVNVVATLDSVVENLPADQVGNSRSAFEQYQGLHIIDSLAYVFDEEAKSSVVELIQDQRRAAPGKYISRGTDRWQLSERILSKIQIPG